ncbi:MAG: hypothetical protein LAT78_04835 [Roseinatronobacter sp.]|nr:hypothetical protein [Roseinatronobacter sp.]
MSHQTTLALVPVAQTLPARHIPAPQRRPDPPRDPYALADRATRLHTSAEVERYLPDILGRALARCWIDPEFRARFCADARATLAAHRIELPAAIGVDVVTQGQTRPMVIVSERLPRSTQSRRLLYLQLVMVAGK